MRLCLYLYGGASSGIGEGTAIHLASLGCRLSLHGRNAENLQKVAVRCQEAGAAKEQVCTYIISYIIMMENSRGSRSLEYVYIWLIPAKVIIL